METKDLRRIVLLGKTGSGKSSLANTILGEKRFEVSDSPYSETKTCSAVTRTVRGRNICLIDAPGIFDTDPTTTSCSQVVLSCLDASAPGPHAFLLVLKVERYTQQEKAVVEIILQYFSEEALKYTTVVFTRGGDLQEGKRIEDWVKQSAVLSQLVQKCGGRLHVVDNTHWNNNQNIYRNNQNQVEALLNTIDRAVEENGGTYYTISNWQTIKNYWWRFREAPEMVQWLLFFGRPVVVALLRSKVPWAVIMVKVEEAAAVMAAGAEWLWKEGPTINPEMTEAITFLATLHNGIRQINNVNEEVRRCRVL